MVWCWLKDDEIEECCDEERDEAGETVLDDMGQPVLKYTKKLKYPKGRKIVIAANVILEDGENQYEDGEIPLSRCQNYMLPREFWGISEIEPLESPQKIFNKLVCFALDVMTLMGNPIWIVPQTSGIDTDNLFNRPGDILEPADAQSAQGIRRESGVQLQPFVLQLIDRMRNWFDSISGSQDVTRGVNPTGVTAMGAIEALQEAAQTRTRQKLRLLDCYLQTVGQQYASRVMQFYTVPRIFRLTNKQGLDRYFKFSVSTTEDETGNPIRVARIQKYVDNAGQLAPSPEINEYQLRGRLDVRATTGSDLPFAKSEKEQRLTKMFELGIIDAEEVLKGMDYPNADLVLSRMKAAQAAQQPPMPPEGSAPPPAAA